MDANHPPQPEDRVRRGLGTWLALAIVFAFIGLLVVGVVIKSPNTTIDDNLSRNIAVAAPPFRLDVLERGALGPNLTQRLRPAFADGRISSNELRGTPYVLNIWASWCVPCREEAPRLQQAWRKARPRGVLFVGLDMQDVHEDAREFLREFEIDYLNIRDPSNDVARAYGATGVPETFFISADGKVVNHVIGVVSDLQLNRGVAAAVSGKPFDASEGGDRRPAR